jgi:HD-GYP domain-containing protein (c-di-GMP phosphodiesterase class II)
MLATRLAAVAVLIGAVLGSVAFFAERDRVQDTAVELAQIQMERFNRQAMPVLSASAAMDPAAVQTALEQFQRTSGDARLRNGHFVTVRLFDAKGRETARLADPEFADIGIVQQALDDADYVIPAPGDVRVVTTRLGGKPYVGVALPLVDPSGAAAGHAAGVFAVSEEAVARMRGNAMRTALYVVGIVLVTAAVLYPVILQLLGRLNRLAANLLDANLETMQVLGSAIAKRDSDTDAHNYRVTVYSVRLAETVGLPRDEIRSLIKGALLHDVGKLGIRDNILLKPGRLDEEEFAVMRTHVEHGVDITARARWLQDAQEIVAGHHEKFDGGGYPVGLSGEAIPVVARIFAIADVFDALTSQRPYKERIGFEESMEILASGRNSHFDPQLLDAFSRIAPELHETYGGDDGTGPREQLEHITQQYFRRDLADLMA